jgi:lipoyl(octanoyl) transferase
MWSVFIERHSEAHPFRFADLLALQERELARLRVQGGGALLFAELPPTLTLGARQVGQEEPRFDFLKASGVDIRPGGRGGSETWHGPGQWVGFVLVSLESFTGDSRGVRKAVMEILNRVLRVAREYRPEVRIEEGERLGLWTDQGKLASIGIRIRDGFTSSGFALNAIPDPSAFLGIDPCGLRGTRPDFLFSTLPAERQREEFEALPLKLLAAFEGK